MLADADLDFVEALLEAKESINSNALVRRAGPLELVRSLTLLAENVAVTNAENLGARHSMLVATFVEEWATSISLCLVEMGIPRAGVR